MRHQTQAIVNASAKTREAFTNGEAIKCFSRLQRLIQTINNCHDTDLIEVSAHLGARPDYEEWQGKVYYLAGERDYTRDFNGKRKTDVQKCDL